MVWRFNRGGQSSDGVYTNIACSDPLLCAAFKDHKNFCMEMDTS